MGNVIILLAIYTQFGIKCFTSENTQWTCNFYYYKVDERDTRGILKPTP